MSRRILLFVAALLIGGQTHAWAAWHTVIYTEDNSGVAIEVSSPFDSAPPTGYLPLWVTIRNSSGAARTWSFVCDGENLMSVEHKHAASEPLHVENGQTARFPILMPMGSTNSGYYYRTHPFRIEGYGTNGNTVTAPGTTATPRYAATPVLGMSEDLATPIWGALTKWYTDHSLDLLGTPMDLSLLGGDWRALVGLDILWVSDTGYATLDAAQRGVVRDWVNQGGVLCLCAQGADPSLRAAVGLSETGEKADVGLGRVVLMPWDGKPLTLDRVTDLPYPFESRRAGLTAASAEDWPMAHSVGPIEINAPLLIAFIVLFALAVGPLNLFVFASSTRRHRLFWTTPAISVGASLLLMVFIFLQDGFGGAGQRAMLCVLLPDQKKIVVLQEQVARTGVLMSRQFHLSEDLVLTPLHLEGRATRTYRQTGRDYTGDWFTSRSVQAHRAKAVVPSRAEIQLVNADAARDGAPPVVVSNVPAGIRKISYLDASGRHWVGDGLRTGERISLRAGDPGEGDYATGTGATLDEEVKSLAGRPGYFVAVADDGPFFETLPAIRWQAQRAIFAGPVTAAH